MTSRGTERILFIVLSALLLSGYSQGQKMGAYGLSGGVDLQMGVKSGSYHSSVTYYELTSVLKTKFLYVGWTGRLSGFYGNDLNYYTAPARITRGQAGLGSLGKPVQIEHIDTLYVGHTAHTSLNVGFRVECYVGRFTLGASVDLLGFTFLRHAQTDWLTSSTGRFSGTDSLGYSQLKAYKGADAYQVTTPQRFNVRLLGDNDRGMLTTEAYIRFLITSQIGVKLSYQLTTTEVTISHVDVTTGNNRFRNRLDLLAIGFTVPISPY